MKQINLTADVHKLNKAKTFFNELGELLEKHKVACVVNDWDVKKSTTHHDSELYMLVENIKIKAEFEI